MKRTLFVGMALLLLVQLSFAQDKLNTDVRDEFFWLSQINKATVVINTDEGILTKEQGKTFADAIKKVVEDGNKAGGKRPKTALSYEPLLIVEGGQDITLIHAGRSSQDMHATLKNAILRDKLLELARELNNVSGSLLKLADKNVNTIVPNYTNGVMAQPNSYAHYLLGFAAAFERDEQRIRQAYERFDKSAMGTTVLNGTSWNLNRKRMSDYLGYPGIIDNAYDAGQIATVDQVVELGAVVQGVAIHVGTFIEDLMPQYSQVTPWILLDEKQTYASTAMPQKRNPGIINNTRTKASYALSAGIGAAIVAHNITPGMADPKDVKTNGAMIDAAIAALKDFNKVLSSLVVNPERALEEVNSDWASSQELADVLMRKYKIPFRVGHHYASMLVDYGRTNNIKPLDFPYSEAQRIYKEAVEEYKAGSELPMSEKEFKDTLNPINIVNNRATSGASQASEITRMLKNAKANTELQTKWIENKTNKIADSLKKLDNDFAKLTK